jgi:pentatricopeptide repeat protein
MQPDVVAYNTVMHAQAANGNLRGMLDVLSALTAAGLRPTAATYATLMHAHVVAGAMPAVLELWYQMLQARVMPGTVCLRSYALAAFHCGDAVHIQDSRSRYFSHLLALPQKQFGSEACIFLNMHGNLAPGEGYQWPPGLSPVQLCVALMRRNGHQPHGQVQSTAMLHEHVQLQAHHQSHGPRPQHKNLSHAQLRGLAPAQTLHDPMQAYQLQGFHHPQLHGVLPNTQHIADPQMRLTHAQQQQQAQCQAPTHVQGYAHMHAQAQQIMQQAAQLASLHALNKAPGQFT